VKTYLVEDVEDESYPVDKDTAYEIEAESAEDAAEKYIEQREHDCDLEERRYCLGVREDSENAETVYFVCYPEQTWSWNLWEV
jgi:hypothetical protein